MGMTYKLSIFVSWIGYWVKGHPIQYLTEGDSILRQMLAFHLIKGTQNEVNGEEINLLMFHALVKGQKKVGPCGSHL
jgi:hypothetical protein